MKVRMKVKISGTRDGEDWPDVGDVIDVPKDEADSLIANGSAEPATGAAPVTDDAEDGEKLTPKQRLQAEARALGVDDGGKVSELEERIAAAKQAAANREANGEPSTATAPGGAETATPGSSTID